MPAVESLAELLDETRRLKNCVFRGVKRAATHKLIPSAGRRLTRDIRKIIRAERAVFREFKRVAIRFLAELPIEPQNDWEWLAVAQHYGLPTRLLDWTTDPLVAAYFACSGLSANEDSAVFVVRDGSRLDTVKFPNPFELRAMALVLPPHVTDRLAAQSGLFSVHPDPRTAYTHPNLSVITIPRDARRLILQQLGQSGYTSERLFPGLDGLCARIRFEYRYD